MFVEKQTTMAGNKLANRNSKNSKAIYLVERGKIQTPSLKLRNFNIALQATHPSLFIYFIYYHYYFYLPQLFIFLVKTHGSGIIGTSTNTTTKLHFHIIWSFNSWGGHL